MKKWQWILIVILAAAALTLILITVFNRTEPTDFVTTPETSSPQQVVTTAPETSVPQDATTLPGTTTSGENTTVQTTAPGVPIDLAVESGVTTLFWGEDTSWWLNTVAIEDLNSETPVIVPGELYRVTLQFGNGRVKLESMYGKVFINDKPVTNEQISHIFDWWEARIDIAAEQGDGELNIRLDKGITNEAGEVITEDICFVIKTVPVVYADLGLVRSGGTEEPIWPGTPIDLPQMTVEDKEYLLHFSDAVDRQSVEQSILSHDTAAEFSLFWQDAQTLQIKMNKLIAGNTYKIDITGAVSEAGYRFGEYWDFEARPRQEIFAWNPTSGAKSLIYSLEQWILLPVLNQSIDQYYLLYEDRLRYRIADNKSGALVPIEERDVLGYLGTGGVFVTQYDETSVLFCDGSNDIWQINLATGKKSVFFTADIDLDDNGYAFFLQCSPSPSATRFGLLAVGWDGESAALFVTDSSGKNIRRIDGIYCSIPVMYSAHVELAWLNDTQLLVPKADGTWLIDLETGAETLWQPYRINGITAYTDDTTGETMIAGYEVRETGKSMEHNGERYQEQAYTYFYIKAGERHDILSELSEWREGYYDYAPHHVMIFNSDTIILSGLKGMFRCDLSTGRQEIIANAVAFGVSSDGQVYYMTNPVSQYKLDAPLDEY